MSGSDSFDRSRAALNRSPLDDRRLLSGPFWGELRIFLAVAKAKSFNRAAKILNMSQPTVSRRVRRLQDLIGSQLFLSSPSGIVLTDKGRDLAETLLILDERLSSISRNLRAESQDAEGLVRVSSTEALAGLFIVPRLQDFNERYQKISLHIKSPINLTSFNENQSDIVIGFSSSDQPGIDSRQLGFVHLIPYASHEYFSRFGVPDKTNLEEHRFVDAEYYSSENDAWGSWRAAVSRGSVSHLCDNSFSYCFMVKEGLGIGLLGNYVLPDPSLVPLELGIHIRLPIYLQVAAERLNSRPVRAVYDWLTEILGSRNHWFSPDLNLGGAPQQLMSETLTRVLLNDWRQ